MARKPTKPPIVPEPVKVPEPKVKKPRKPRVVKVSPPIQEIERLVELPPDESVKEPTVDVVVTEKSPNHGLIVANLIVALIVCVGILVWNYNYNWNKPVNKAEITVANPYSVAKAEPVAPQPLISTTPVVEDKPVTIAPTPPPPAPVEVKAAEPVKVDNALFLQNSVLTPGAVDETATKEVVCSGYSKRTRLIGQVNKLKVFNLYMVDWKSDSFEVDHLIPLGLGGANSIENLWPQSYTTKPWNAHKKDRLESQLHRMVCSGKMELKEAQELIKTDWIEAYKKLVKE